MMNRIIFFVLFSIFPGFAYSAGLWGTNYPPADGSGTLTYPGEGDKFLAGNETWKTAVVKAANITALANITATVGQVFSVAGFASPGDGGGGTFIWQSGDYSANVSADTLHGVYVPSINDSDGSDGCFVREIIGGFVTPEYWGAKGDHLTDDYEALQAAISFATSNNMRLYLSKRWYMISANLVVSGRIHIYGAGKNDSYIQAISSAVTRVIELPQSTSDTNVTARSTFSGFSISGNSAAQYGISGVTNHSVFRDVVVINTTTWAMDISYGWGNKFDGVELSSNTGGGLDLSKNGSSNGVGLINCKIFNNSGIGVKINGSYGSSINSGTIIENNAACGVYIVGSCEGIDISEAYFEANGADGLTFTTPATTIYADIIVNGSGSATSLAGTYPAKVSVRGCYVSNSHNDYFVYQQATNGGSLTLEGNSTAGSKSQILLGTYGGTSVSFSYGRFSNVKMSNNTGFSAFTGIDTLSGTILNFSTEYLNIINQDADQTNYAVSDVSQWSLLAAGVTTTWNRSSREVLDNVKDAPVWALATVDSGSSAKYGFSLSAADYPNNVGKIFCFSVDTSHDFTSDGNIVLYVVNVANTGSYSSVNTWSGQSVVFEWPASGTLYFGVYKIGAAGSIYVHKPVLSELGANARILRETIAHQTDFKLSSYPTAGDWLLGDRVIRKTPASGQPKAWVCTVAGTPGTWVSEGNL